MEVKKNGNGESLSDELERKLQQEQELLRRKEAEKAAKGVTVAPPAHEDKTAEIDPGHVPLNAVLKRSLRKELIKKGFTAQTDYLAEQEKVASTLPEVNTFVHRGREDDELLGFEPSPEYQLNEAISFYEGYSAEFIEDYEKAVEEEQKKEAEEAAKKAAEVEEAKPAEKDAEKPSETEGEKPAEKDTEKPLEKEGEKPEEKPSETEGEKPVETKAEKPSEAVTEKEDPVGVQPAELLHSDGIQNPVTLQGIQKISRQKENNCFAVTAAAMYNQHLVKQRRLDDNTRLDQDIVRGYRPRFKTYSEYCADSLEGASTMVYKKEVDDVRSFTTPHSGIMGNIYALSDMFLQMDSNICTNNMVFSYAGLTSESHKMLQDYFLKTLDDILSKGEAVGFYKQRHYMTIVGVEGAKVKYLDSAAREPNTICEKDVWEILSGTDGTVELTWFSDRSELKTKVQCYKNLELDGDKLSSTWKSGGQNDVGHTLGVASEKKKDVMVSEGMPEAISENVQHIVYASKTGDTPDLDLKDLRRKANTYYEYQEDLYDSYLEESIQASAVKDKNKPSVVDPETEKAVAESFVEKEIKRRQDELPERKHIDDISATYPVPKVPGFIAAADMFVTNPYELNLYEFKYLQEALHDNVRILKKLDRGNFDFDAGSYDQYLRLYQATSAFVSKYVDTGDKKMAELYKAAGTIKEQLDKVSEYVLFNSEIPAVDMSVNANDPEKKSAKENVERLLTPYRTYCKRVDEDLLATDEQKIRRKWDALKSSERDVLIYLSLKKSELKGGALKGEDAFLEKEYVSLKQQILLLSLTRGNGEEEEKMFNSDDGLTNEQIGALSRIDTWIIRNFRNGGIMSLAGVYADRSDIVGQLLSMSRRRRLYIYYLVEKRERVNPTPEGFTKSQSDYIPDLNAFKGMMIASKAKFYKRFTGGYIYWHKLTEAMGIAESAKDIISTAEETLKNGNPAIPDQETDYSSLDGDVRTGKAIEDMLAYSLEAMRLTRENEKPDIPDDQKDANQRRLDMISARSRRSLTEIVNIAIMMKSEYIEEFSRKSDVQTYGSTMFKDASSYTSLALGIVKQGGAPIIEDIAGIDIKEACGYIGAGPSALSAIGGLVGSLFTFYTMWKGAKSMTTLDIVANSFTVSNGIVASAKSVNGIIAAFTTNSTISAIASPAVGATFAAVETGIAVVKTASFLKNGHYRRKAARIVHNKESADEFDKAMVELEERIGKRQKTSTLTSAVSAGCSLTAAILIATGVLTAGLGFIAGGITMGIGVYAKVADSSHSRDAKMMLFDGYYNMDREYAAAEAEYKRRNPNVPLDEEGRIRLLDQLRRKIASSHGFYSPSHAAKAIAAEFAAELRDRAHQGTQDGDNEYIAMIRGMGLSYRYGGGFDVPTESDIVKKMCG